MIAPHPIKNAPRAESPHAPRPPIVRRLIRRHVIVGLPVVLVSMFGVYCTFQGWMSWAWISMGLAWVGFIFLMIPRISRIGSVLLRHKGYLCTNCVYPLPREPSEGVCPECGVAYDLASTRESWRRVLPASGPIRRRFLRWNYHAIVPWDGWMTRRQKNRRSFMDAFECEVSDELE